MTPLAELGEINHTIIIQNGPRMYAGQTIRGHFEGGEAVYFATVVFATKDDAVAEVISNIRECIFQKGQRIRFVFEKSTHP